MSRAPVALITGSASEVPTVRFSAVAPAWPVAEDPWYSADVDWRALSPSAMGAARATAEAVVFLANDKEGHGQVIRIPSGITT